MTNLLKRLFKIGDFLYASNTMQSGQMTFLPGGVRITVNKTY
jgi:hypothetical protein